MRLKDKVILITGSTTGVGEGMARMFAEEGAFVIVHGTREDAAKTLVAEITAKGGRAGYVIGSLDDAEVPAKLIASVIEQCGRIDALVNNAAVMTRTSLETTDLETWDRTIAVNLRAPYLLIQAALPHFRKQGGGKILNIGSINGYCGERNQFVYSISKGGLMTLTRNIADAYGPEGIRIHQFNLGWVLTPNEYALKIKEGLPDDWPEKVPRTYAPSGRIMTPVDVAYGAVYFLSDEAPLINGSVLDFEQYPLIGRNPVKEPL
jgi:NAD(P)-dependent dehydrogenase (short-subunit alcohol dehydrogenase family)